ncbi:MAG: RNA polymerase sigma factor [Rhizobiaceae bacterium]|nr:RNA polymerase sigma factor [Rhizobiaceae bacterium]
MEAIVRHRGSDLAGVDDRKLVELARLGDEMAVRALVQRYNRRLYRVARAVLRDDAEAEDVVQEAHVSAFASLDRYRGDAGFGTWITRIALNAALGRKRKRRPSLPLDDFEREEAGEPRVIAFPAAQPNPEQAMARSQVRDLLEQVVEELPDIFRVVFVLRDIEELSVEETAAHLELKPATVKTRLHRARGMMRAALARRAASSLPDLFPFAGTRCDRMGDRVVAALRRERPDLYPPA